MPIVGLEPLQFVSKENCYHVLADWDIPNTCKNSTVPNGSLAAGLTCSTAGKIKEV
jgi:hypothetical protein